MTKIAELYGRSTTQTANWNTIVTTQHCPFLDRKCLKNRKSEPHITIGTCSMVYGRDRSPIIICPFRLLERRQILQDCTHLLKLHEPGNEIRVITELNVPGGSIDYCLVSVRAGKPKDFVGIELQTLDTTGTVWPERQRFLKRKRISVKREDAASDRSFGLNWKMTAKTTLVQLHHKISTFEHLGKHLVLIMQDRLLEYMRREFAFGGITGVRGGDPMHFHAYDLSSEAGTYTLGLVERISTDANGIAACLGLKSSPKVELVAILDQIEAKLPISTPLTIGAIPVPVKQSN